MGAVELDVVDPGTVVDEGDVVVLSVVVVVVVVTVRGAVVLVVLGGVVVVDDVVGGGLPTGTFPAMITLEIFGVVQTSPAAIAVWRANSRRPSNAAERWSAPAVGS